MLFEDMVYFLLKALAARQLRGSTEKVGAKRQSNFRQYFGSDF